MKTEKIINTAYAVGAAIVVFAAWRKILHLSNADLFLTIGLLTEVVIFLVTAVYEWLPSNKEIQSGNSYSVAQELPDNSKLTDSIDTLTNTIKKVFNQ